MTTSTPLPPVISADDLAAVLDRDDHVVILEVRRGRGGGDEGATGAGHLPGAHLVDFADVVGPRTQGSGGNPLPGEAQLRTLVERWGIHDGGRVVVYTPDHASTASRVWWVLRWAGLTGAQFLDGGLAAWRAHGGALSDATPPTGGGTATITLGSLPTLDAAQAAALARKGHLLDARGHRAYVGNDVDAEGEVTGHIPGAVSLPGSDNLSDGLLADGPSLRAIYEPHIDGSPIGSYCGSGVAATLDILALETLGIRASLYPGSWSAWSTDPDLPVAKGDAPG
jgi:thiosulfate/3-mercaptopyruvate sulfurtransferase